jgi:hypothetical protein
MANLLADGAATLAAALKASASESVSYYREGYPPLTGLLAAAGSSLLRVRDSAGSTKVERTECDFLITAADLVIGGRVVEPKAGDRVHVAAGTKTLIFQVMAPTGEPPFRYSDPARTILRIHTKHVETR